MSCTVSKTCRFHPSEAEVVELAKHLKAVVFDFDGVFTENTEWLGIPDGTILKARSHYDGQGISILRDAGLRIAIATSASKEAAYPAIWLCERWNKKLPSVQPSCPNPWLPVTLFTGAGHIDKARVVQSWLQELMIKPEECAVMGDDLTDLPMMELAGLRAAPVTAESVVRDRCHFVSQRPGGRGAIRDLANFILKSREVDFTTLRLC